MFTLGSPSRCVHNLLLARIFADPSSSCGACSLGDIRLHAELGGLHHHIGRVIALVCDDRLDLVLASGFLEIHCCVDRRIDHRCRISGVPGMHRRGDDQVAFQIHRVLGLVGHPRDPSVRIIRVFPIVVRDLLSRPCLVELPEFCIGRLVEPRLFGELLRVVLPALARVLADDRLHRSVGLDRRRVDAELVTPEQALSDRHPEDELKNLVEYFLREPLVGLADRRVVGRLICRPQSEKLSQRPAVGASPRDAAMGGQALEVPHEGHPKEDTRRNRGTPHNSRVKRGAQSLDKGIEVVFGQEPIQRRVERVTGRPRQVRGRHEDLQLPLPFSLPKSHASLLGCQASEARDPRPQFSALSPAVKPTFSTAC